MRVPRVHVPGVPPPGGTVRLPLPEARHLAVVLRRGPGDRVLLLSEVAGSWDAEISAVAEGGGGPEVDVRVLGPSPSPPATILPWTVAAAPVRGERFELAVEMAAEVGVRRLVPVITERTVVRLPPDSRKVDRWRRIGREAGKQCGRASPLEILAPLPLGDLLASWRAIAGAGSPPEASPEGWILHPGGPFDPGVLDAGSSGAGTGPDPPALFLIGPEGGFSPAEVAASTRSGLGLLGFPTPILRASTALALIGALGILARTAAWSQPG